MRKVDEPENSTFILPMFLVFVWFLSFNEDSDKGCQMMSFFTLCQTRSNREITEKAIGHLVKALIL